MQEEPKTNDTNAPFIEKMISTTIREARFDKEMSRRYKSVGKIVTMREAPMFTDVGRIGEMCAAYFAERPRRSLYRRAFLFGVLLLFCPMRLVGERISSTLRRRLSEAMGVGGESLSYEFRSLVFQYEHYSDFRAEVCSAVGMMCGIMGDGSFTYQEK